ncbi:hypothetical protein NB689_003122 [Xanthomonas sacchari]|nr:hypothetical protein [Xanthomonas sacchari]
MRQQDRRRLGADAGDAGNVVDRIAGQCQVVGDLVRMHPMARLDPGRAPALAAAVVPLFVELQQQLRQILVGGHDHAVETIAARTVQGAADQVVGLVVVVRQHAQAQCRAQRLAMRELAAQRVRRRRAVGLVGGVQAMPEAAVQRFVEGDHDVLRALALEQVEQEAGEAVHRIGRPALCVLEFVGNRMPGAEHVQAGVDQVQRPRQGQACVHGVQSLSSARGSGRSRSGTSRRAVPMWMKPATCSCSARPSRADTVSSYAIQPVSHCAPKP